MNTAAHTTIRDEITFERIARRSARRTPCHKKRYRNESEALDASKRLRRIFAVEYRAYPCTARNCGGWHLTTAAMFESTALTAFLASTAAVAA